MPRLAVLSAATAICAAFPDSRRDPFGIRTLGLEYAGAHYHVMNRGNYRRDVFETTGAAMAFETTLGEACV